MSISKNWIKLSVFAYVVCVLTYNFFGTASMGWTHFYYTYEKGFAALCIAYSFQEVKTLVDRLFINFQLITMVGTWLFFVVCSFKDEWWVHHQTILISTMILAMFGSLIVLWYMLKSVIERMNDENL